jgi:uncharacterized membrane protein HdeD (DUF308 family)
MAATHFPFFLSAVAEELNSLRRNWGWLLALGIALIIVGTMAICFPVMATLATVEVLGYFLVIGGVVEAVSGFWARRWGGFLLHLLCGLLYLFLGVVIIERPGLGAAAYTLMLAVFFFASGVVRIVLAVGQQFSGWGWTLLSGVVTLLLGMMIWRNLPEAALWVIGTFVGIDLIFNGWSWVMLALAARSLPSGEPTPGQAPDKLARV